MIELNIKASVRVLVVVVVSGMQLRSTIRRHRHPQSQEFWANSGSVRWRYFRSCWTVLSHVMWDEKVVFSSPLDVGLTESASALSSIICPNRVSRHNWITAMSLGCFVCLSTSSFRTNWYHLMPSSICRHHWSSAVHRYYVRPYLISPSSPKYW